MTYLPLRFRLSAVRRHTLPASLLCVLALSLLLPSLRLHAQAQNGAPPAAVAPVPLEQKVSATVVEKLQRLFQPGDILKPEQLSDTLRAERVAHLFVRNANKAQVRQAAVWFLTKFLQDKQPFDYWAAAGMAIERLSEPGAPGGLTDEERAILQQMVGNNPKPMGRIDTVAEMVLLEDRLRGLSEEEKLPEYQKLLLRNDADGRNAFLIVRHYHVPPTLLHYWNGGPRFEKTGRPSYNGGAGQLYWQFRERKFASPEAEMTFLWGRIQDCYANLAAHPVLPDPYEELRCEEAFAATARFIEMGDAAVPFILKQRDFILSAYDPADAHALTGFNFEMEIIRASRHPAFKPLLKELMRSGSKRTHGAALGAYHAIETDRPSSFVPHYIFCFDPPHGF